jgi:lysophospholipase L1-like esterase
MIHVSARGAVGISVVLALAIAGAVLIGSTAGGPSSLKNTAPTSTGTGPLVAFYGDSYTLGTRASSPDKRWSTIVCRDHGWREFNPSHNGLGFIRNRTLFGQGDLPDLIIRKHPDMVIVTLGLNDNFAFAASANAIHRQIGADFARLTRALPDARFIVVEPFWYTDARPPSVDVIDGWVKAAAADIHADYIPGASHWIEHHPEWMASDGLHPNDRGYAQIARRMNAALKNLGL